ncbi:MAG TPA: hypothetical protein VFS47_02790 [Steroidobacteraceae bacterium]|nr:hypothetical protein [Steroidobacteraceae bacterium]
MSKIVWHASAHAGEGFAAIPISNWEGFIRGSLESPDGLPDAPPVSITIDRIFLKTFADPDYYACQVKLTVQSAGKSSSGTGVVKFEGRAQELIFRREAVLKPVSANAIRLALRAAYLDATARLRPTAS